MHRREFMGGAAALGAMSLAGRAAGAELSDRVPILIETREATGELKHVWSECAGSDRAAITMRESWRGDLDRWVGDCGLKRVRFHGIFADEMGVFAPSILNRGKPSPNFRNVFEVYDGLVARGVDPFVEVGFMPGALASGKSTFGFYEANITPPKSMEDWAAFIRTFVGALADRYGIAKVRGWNFEVWNEPNLPFFWSGKQQDYFDLYKATAVAIKSIDPAIAVGGPATSGGKWVDDFARFCAQSNAPVDFISTHAYAGGNQEDLYGKDARFSVNQVIPDTVRKVHGQVQASACAGKPIWLSEWSSDSPAMIAEVVTQCLPVLRGMSHWVLSGTYEELGVPDYLLKEGDMGWATMVQGIARPSFNTYRLLHRLGTRRLKAEGPALASRRDEGGVSALVWNLAEALQPAGIPGATSERKVTGSPKRFDVRFAGAREGQKVKVSFVDQERGSPMPAWRAMGSPRLPTPAQIETLRKASSIAAPVTLRLDRNASVSVDLPPEGVALLELV